MSVDETLLCSFQVSPPMLPLICSMYLIRLCVDPETGGEKGEVPLWWDERGTSGDATTQAEEEGQQDGLDDDGQRTLFALHQAIVFKYLALSSSYISLHPVFPLPIFTSLVFVFFPFSISFYCVDGKYLRWW